MARKSTTTTTTTPATAHSSACRAHAIGCAVENVRDAGGKMTAARLVAEGDGYLETGTATCLCGVAGIVVEQAQPWIALGSDVLRRAERRRKPAATKAPEPQPEPEPTPAEPTTLAPIPGGCAAVGCAAVGTVPGVFDGRATVSLCASDARAFRALGVFA